MYILYFSHAYDFPHFISRCLLLLKTTEPSATLPEFPRGRPQLPGSSGPDKRHGWDLRTWGWHGEIPFMPPCPEECLSARDQGKYKYLRK